ncbi:MAG: hypothetical protein M5R36_17440 [Deltaproteobacteria bacterium]|nr:hypothetical protein [Deltaproteobacteria bacterium]
MSFPHEVGQAEDDARRDGIRKLRRDAEAPRGHAGSGPRHAQPGRHDQSDRRRHPRALLPHGRADGHGAGHDEADADPLHGPEALAEKCHADERGENAGEADDRLDEGQVPLAQGRGKAGRARGHAKKAKHPRFVGQHHFEDAAEIADQRGKADFWKRRGHSVLLQRRAHAPENRRGNGQYDSAQCGFLQASAKGTERPPGVKRMRQNADLYHGQRGERVLKSETSGRFFVSIIARAAYFLDIASNTSNNALILVGDSPIWRHTVRGCTNRSSKSAGGGVRGEGLEDAADLDTCVHPDRSPGAGDRSAGQGGR